MAASKRVSKKTRVSKLKPKNDSLDIRALFRDPASAVNEAVEELLDKHNDQPQTELTNHKNLPVSELKPTYMSATGQKIECQPCYDEAGSSSCIRPSHSGYVSKDSTVWVKKTLPNPRIDTWFENLIDRLDRYGETYFEGESWQGFFAGVGKNQRIDELRAMVEAYRKEHIFKKSNRKTLSEEQIIFHIKSVAGRVLTIMDATLFSEAQNKAIKTLIKKEFREQLSRLFKQLHTDDGNCASESNEDRQTRDLNLNE